MVLAMMEPSGVFSPSAWTVSPTRLRSAEPTRVRACAAAPRRCVSYSAVRCAQIMTTSTPGENADGASPIRTGDHRVERIPRRRCARFARARSLTFARDDGLRDAARAGGDPLITRVRIIGSLSSDVRSDQLSSSREASVHASLYCDRASDLVDPRPMT